MIDILLANDDGGLITTDDGRGIVVDSYSATPPNLAGHSAADYAAALHALLPHGRLWPRDAGSVQSKTVTAMTPSWARNDARARALLQDAFPVAPAELLPEWEASLGLPDPCSGPAPSFSGRQMQVAAKFVARGGQTPAYFIGVAALLGYAITIQEFAPSRFGRRFGRTFGGLAWADAWQVTVPSLTVTKFRFGRERFGDRFAAWGGQELACTLGRIKPAHTVLTYAYTGIDS